MSVKSLLNRFLTAGFDVSEDLMLRRKLILVTTLQSMVFTIFIFFATYNYLVTGDYIVGTFDTIGMVITAFAAYILHVKRKLQAAIYIVVVVLFFFLNALSAANQNESYGIIWNFFYPIFVILLLGHKKSHWAIVPFYMVLLTQAYLGIGEWQNGEWDLTSFVRFTFASVVVVYSAYFNEWSLDRSYTELQRVRAREKEANKEYTDNMLKMLENKKQLLVDVSHELRTPLSVLKVYFEALEDGINNKEESYPVLQRKLGQIDRLISDIYLLSKSDINQLNIQKEQIYIEEMLSELFVSFEQLAQENDLTLKLNNNLNEEDMIAGDWERLIQVYSNLLQNSINYTNSGGVVEVSARTLNNGVEITVDDTTPGVPEADQLKLLERLYRQDSSRNRATGGSGLGLAICKAIIDVHNGTISVSSSHLGGLKISTWLPFSKLEDK